MDIYKECSICLFDEKIPNITFDERGICSYCNQIKKLEKEFSTGQEEGKIKLNKIIEKIKKDGRKLKYDCVVGVSGGTDSSFLLFKAKEWGLRPLAVHYDNTWNTAIATQNISKVTKYLNIDLFTYVINNKEADDIFYAFLQAGVPEFDASTDIAYAQVLRMAAGKYKVKYILEGHSFKAEGLSPIGNNYFDGRYVTSVHSKFGRSPLKTYPNLTFFQFMKWIFFYKQNFIRPLWYIDYSKAAARNFLIKECGWIYYGGHHLENRSSTFLHTIYNPIKFQIDNRNWGLSAEIRSGIISKSEAKLIYSSMIEPNPDLLEFVKKRLRITDKQFNEIMKGKKRSWRNFKTYKKIFELLRPLFAVLVKMDRVPYSFYKKYCFPLVENK